MEAPLECNRERGLGPGCDAYASLRTKSPWLRRSTEAGPP